jgi:hypothetical protein
MILIPGGHDDAELVSDLSTSGVRGGEQRPVRDMPEVTQGCLAALGRPVPVDEDGMLHPHHDMTDIGGEQTLG